MKNIILSFLIILLPFISYSQVNVIADGGQKVTATTVGHVLTWDGAKWVAQAPVSISGSTNNVAVFTGPAAIGNYATFSYTSVGGLYVSNNGVGVKTAATIENTDATDGNSTAIDFKNNNVLTSRIISSNPNPGAGGLSFQVRDASASANQNYVELTDEDQIKLNRSLVIGSESLTASSAQITGDYSISSLETGVTSVTLPEIVNAPVSANQVELGTTLTVPNNTTLDIIISRAGSSDLIIASGVGVTSLLLKAGQTLYITATGSNKWSYVISGDDVSEKLTLYNLAGASSGTVTLTNADIDNLIYNGAATITTLTVTLPSSPIDGQICKISTGSGMSITTLTISGPVVSTNPTTWPAGSSVEYKYYSTLAAWVIKYKN